MRLEREAGGRRAWRGIKGVKKGEGRQRLGRRLPRQGSLWSRGGEDGLITRASQEGWLELCVSCVPGDLACYQDGWMWGRPRSGFGPPHRMPPCGSWGAGRRMVGSDVLPFSPRIPYFCPNRKCSLAWGPCFRDAVSVAGLLLTFFAQFLFFIFGAKWRPDSTLGTK